MTDVDEYDGDGSDDDDEDVVMIDDDYDDGLSSWIFSMCLRYFDA